MKAGFAKTDVTPELGVRLGGYGVKERPAEEILDRLQATAIVIEQDGLKAAVINLDWICIEEDIVERIRAGINKSTGIPNKNISVCATHSHSVPNTLNFWGWGDRENEYIDSIIPEIIRSAELANEKMQEVSVGIATTESLVGVNRRSVAENNGVCFRGDPMGSFDPTMTVINFMTKDGIDSGIIVHYGAHGTAMGNNRLVSRDWCGVMKDRIESQYPGATVLFLNGAIGDVGPRTNYRKDGGLSAGGGDGIHSVCEVGYRAATDAIRALLSIKEYRSDLKLSVHTEDIFLPYAPLTPLEDAEREKTKWEPRKDDWGTPMCEYMHNCAVIEAHKKEVLKGRSFTQTLISLGPLAIVPMPGEMFSGISLRIRQQSPFQYTLCCSVTNGSLSYLPTREARHRGGYETWVGRAAGPYLLADDIDDALVSENIRLLKKI
ncbi:MAG: hypothetical protein A2017_08930 [Lentisphaerae bacterium GWF2_44_16]|nr:MAG: hypothetical protein A2017_08930 [Lentisphaerae bacterium GWF2_44_16]